MSERQDLVNSAVDFLRNPQIYSAPVEKKVEFLKSKGLNDEEISRALVSVSENGQESAQQGSTQQGGAPVGEYGAAAPAPPLPERDWKDYFIMATTTISLSYGLYYLFKKVLVPSVMPQSYDQLQRDKDAIGAEFARVQTLLDRLEANNESLVERDAANAAKLETAVSRVNNLVVSAENVLNRNVDDLKLVKLEIDNLKSSYKYQNTAVESAVSGKLAAINQELESLKKLLSSRIGESEGSAAAAASGGSSNTGGAAGASASGNGYGSVFAGKKGGVPSVSSVPSAADILKNVPKQGGLSAGSSATDLNSVVGGGEAAREKASADAIDRSEIPAWQLAGSP